MENKIQRKEGRKEGRVRTLSQQYFLLQKLYSEWNQMKSTGVISVLVSC